MTRNWCAATAVFVAAPFGLISAPVAAADLIETAQEVSQSGQFEIGSFATALEASGLAKTLEGGGPYTIFAPTDAVFGTLDVAGLKPQGTAETPEEQLESADQERLADILKLHIVEGEMTFKQLVNQEQLETLEGAKLDVVAAKGGVLINGIEVLDPDIMADNGIIHIVGGLLAAKPTDQTGTEQEQ